MKNYLAGFWSLIILLSCCIGCANENEPSETETAVQYHAMGVKAVEQEKYDSALMYFNYTIEKVPDNEMYRNDRSFVHKKLGNLDAAYADLLRARDINPAYPMAHYNLGMLAVQSGDFELALARFDTALSLGNLGKKEYLERAKVLLRLGEYPRLALDIDTLLEFDSVYFPARAIQCRLQVEQGLYGQAYANIKWCVERDSTAATVWDTYGHLNYKAQRLEHAKKCFQMALKYDPESGSSWQSLAVIHEVAGEKDLQCECLRRASELNYPGSIIEYKYFCLTDSLVGG